MNNLIYRDQAIEAISKLPVKVDNLGYTWMIAGDVLKQIDDIPAAEPERHRGEWIGDGHERVFSECSKCGYIAVSVLSERHYNYCPNCGADMRGDHE